MPTIEDLGQSVKAKYPGQYDDLPDMEVGTRVQKKFPGAYDDYAPIAPPVGAPQALGQIQGKMTADAGTNNIDPSGHLHLASTMSSPIMQGVERTAEPGLDSKAKGASMVLRGVGEAAAPLAIPGLIAAPAATIAGLGGATLGGVTAKGLASAVDAPEGVQDLAGDAGSIVGGGAASRIPAALSEVPFIGQAAKWAASHFLPPPLSTAARAIPAVNIKLNGEIPLPMMPFNREKPGLFNPEWRGFPENKPPNTAPIEPLTPAAQTNRAVGPQPIGSVSTADRPPLWSGLKPPSPVTAAAAPTAEPPFPNLPSGRKVGGIHNLSPEAREFFAKWTPEPEPPAGTPPDIKMATPPGLRTPQLKERGGLTDNEIQSRATIVNKLKPLVEKAGITDADLDKPDVRKAIADVSRKIEGLSSNKATGHKYATSEETIDALQAAIRKPGGLSTIPLKEEPANPNEEDLLPKLQASLDALKEKKAKRLVSK